MKQRILDMLKSAGGYISGEKISETLGITRSAVWKHVNRLKKNGYIIESVKNRGYRLVSSPDIIVEDDIKKSLNTEFVGQNIFFYD